MVTTKLPGLKTPDRKVKPTPIVTPSTPFTKPPPPPGVPLKSAMKGGPLKSGTKRYIEFKAKTSPGGPVRPPPPPPPGTPATGGTGGDTHGQFTQAQIDRFDDQGAYYHSEEATLLTVTQVMDHIIFDLLAEWLDFGPIRSALAIMEYKQPHQVVLCDAANLLTQRHPSGLFLATSIPLDDKSVKAVQLLQAYHEKYLKDTDDRTEFYLDWNLWMHVTHKDLLAFDILSKKRISSVMILTENTTSANIESNTR